MVESKPAIWYVDRSRITTDWQCPRKRYLQYHLGGRGVVPATTSIELFMGSTLHDGLARIADGMDIDEVASTAQRAMYDSLSQVLPGEIPDADTLTFAAEQAALVEGLLRGFHRHAWPRLLQQGWRIIAVEQEMIYRISKHMHFMSKPDLILEDPEGSWWYVEHKSTSSKKSQWVDSWATAVQLHSGIKAVEETLGHPVTGVIVSGLYKGYESYGRQNSPFCYAYVRSGNPPFTADQVQYEYKAGFKRQPTWELPGGVRAWVEAMPEAILADQFPQAPPIFVKDELVEAFFRQVKQREEIIHSAVLSIQTAEKVGGKEEHIQAWLDSDFPQKFDQCQPAWGRGCQFRRICHSRVDNPLEQGYTVREPHHEAERRMFDEQVAANTVPSEMPSL